MCFCGVGVCAFVGVDDDVGAGVILGVVQTATQTTIWLTSFIWKKGNFEDKRNKDKWVGGKSKLTHDSWKIFLMVYVHRSNPNYISF